MNHDPLRKLTFIYSLGDLSRSRVAETATAAVAEEINVTLQEDFII